LRSVLPCKAKHYLARGLQNKGRLIGCTRTQPGETSALQLA